MQTNLDLFSLPATGLNQDIGMKPKAADESKADSFASWLKSYEAPSKAKKSAPNSASEVLNSSQTVAQSGLVGPDVQANSSPMTHSGQELSDEEQDSFSGGMDSQADSEAFDNAAKETEGSTVRGDLQSQQAALSAQSTPLAPAEQVSTSSSSSSLPAPTLEGSIETNATPEAAPAPTLYGFVGSPTTAATQDAQPDPVPGETNSLAQDLGPTQQSANDKANQASDDSATKVADSSVLNQQVSPANDLASAGTPADKVLSSKEATSMATETAKGASDKKPLAPSDAKSKVALGPQSPLDATEFDKATSEDNMADSSESRPSFEKRPQVAAPNVHPTLNDAMAAQNLDSVLATSADVSVDEAAELSPALTAASLSSTEAHKSDLFVTHAAQANTPSSAFDAAASLAATTQEGRVDTTITSTTAAAESLRSMSPATPEFESIAEQLRMQMSPGMSRVSFIVDPPELGRILVRLSMQRGRLVGEISTENREVAKTLESGLSALKINLQESGVNVDSLRVQQDQFLGNGDGHFANQGRSHGAQGERNRSDGRTDRAEVRSDSARSKREQRATDNDGQINLVA